MRNERSHHADRGREEGRKKGRGTKNNVTHNGLCQISTKEREGDDTGDEGGAFSPVS